MKCVIKTITLIESISDDGHIRPDVEKQQKLEGLQKDVEKFFADNPSGKVEWHQTNSVESMANWMGGRMAFSNTITAILTSV